MEDAEKKICQPESPQEGPCDAVQLKTECIRSDFTENEDGTVSFEQKENSEANISASVELGYFSIRDKKTNVMLTVAFEDAIMLMASALEAAKEKDSCQTETSDSVTNVESESDS